MEKVWKKHGKVGFCLWMFTMTIEHVFRKFGGAKFGPVAMENPQFCWDFPS